MPEPGMAALAAQALGDPDARADVAEQAAHHIGAAAGTDDVQHSDRGDAQPRQQFGFARVQFGVPHQCPLQPPHHRQQRQDQRVPLRNVQLGEVGGAGHIPSESKPA